MNINKTKLTAQICNIALLSSAIYLIGQFIRVGAYMIGLPFMIIGIMIILNIIAIGRS